MPRADLLALTEDDLVTLTNRGVVKRALRELDENAATCEIHESPQGDVKFIWSDGAECQIPAGAALADAHCSSGSAGISRYLIRSVLAYQRGQTTTATPPTPAIWDPGAAFSDAALEQQFGSANVARARQRFEAGVLVELVRSPKPLARFLDDPCFLRFMVPGDLRYIHADCPPASLATFVPLAVWAFRHLPADQQSGLVALQIKPLPTPVELLDAIEELLIECACNGLSAAGDVWHQRLLRIEQRCRDAGLIWPAEILADLAEEHSRYRQHDALFSLETTVTLVGELLIRLDAIRAASPHAPQLLVRGTGADRRSEIDAARYVGIGCGARSNRRSTTLTAFLQDVDSGMIVALPREFANAVDDAQPAATPSTAAPRDFHVLAQTAVIRGVSLSTFGLGQLLLKSAKRTPSHRLVLPRTGIGVNPQNFAWEKLRPPLLCESYSELAALLTTMPPASLRSRRATEDVFVLSVARVAEPRFDPIQQAIVATLFDSDGNSSTLCHPYSTRSAAGTEALLHWLTRPDAALRFVSGHVSLNASETIVQPLCAVFDHNGQRHAVQPWIDPPKSHAANAASSTAAAPSPIPSDIVEPPLPPIPAALQAWQTAIGELWLIGTQRVSPDLISQWRDTTAQLESTGLLRLAEHANDLASRLASRLTDPQYTAQPAARQLLTATLLKTLFDES